MDLMIRLVAVHQMVETVRQLLVEVRGDGHYMDIERSGVYEIAWDNVCQTVVGMLGHAQVALKEMGLHVASKEAAHIIELIQRDSYDYSDDEGDGPLVPSAQELVPAIDGLVRIIQHELSSEVFLHIPASNNQQFKERTPFGAFVNDAFPDAYYDITRASKCLALEFFPTACVFHCMRAMEVALRELVRSLGENPDDYNNWGTLIARLNKAASKKRNPPPPWSDRRGELGQIAHAMRGVKDLWRDSTMHVRARYDLEEANDVFLATRNLMRVLARTLHPGTVADVEKEETADNPEGSQDSGTQAEGRVRRPEEGGEPEARREGITGRQSEEEVARTETSPRDGGCTAKRTRPDRTEDA